MLVRSYGETYRADMVGLRAGSYDMEGGAGEQRQGDRG